MSYTRIIDFLVSSNANKTPIQFLLGEMIHRADNWAVESGPSLEHTTLHHGERNEAQCGFRRWQCTFSERTSPSFTTCSSLSVDIKCNPLFIIWLRTWIFIYTILPLSLPQKYIYFTNIRTKIKNWFVRQIKGHIEFLITAVYNDEIQIKINLTTKIRK